MNLKMRVIHGACTEIQPCWRLHGPDGRNCYIKRGSISSRRPQRRYSWHETCLSVTSLYKTPTLFPSRRSPSTTTRHHRLIVTATDGNQDSPPNQKKPGSVNNLRPPPPSRELAALRAEAEAPFRVFRIVIFGFSIISAGLATLFTIPQIIGTLAGGANAKSLVEVGGDLGINLGAVSLFSFLYKRDTDAREKQIARLLREDQLGDCQLQLSNNKVLRLTQLRSFSRPVMLVGTAEQVKEAVQAAERFKEELIDRGVLIIPLPVYGGSREDVDVLCTLSKDDLRWKAAPVRMDEWKAWFDAQAKLAGKTGLGGQGLYVGLRLDGRVRASGVGSPNWAVFVGQLPKTEGLFGGFLDGMDGRVGGG